MVHRPDRVIVDGEKGYPGMEESMTTGDVVIGLVAGVGVVVLVVVFAWVVRMVFFEGDKENKDV